MNGSINNLSLSILFNILIFSSRFLEILHKQVVPILWVTAYIQFIITQVVFILSCISLGFALCWTSSSILALWILSGMRVSIWILSSRLVILWVQVLHLIVLFHTLSRIGWPLLETLRVSNTRRPFSESCNKVFCIGRVIIKPVVHFLPYFLILLLFLLHLC